MIGMEREPPGRPRPSPLLFGALSSRSLGIPLVGDDMNLGGVRCIGNVKLPGWRSGGFT